VVIAIFPLGVGFRVSDAPYLRLMLRRVKDFVALQQNRPRA
jgi:hypothetical protein